MMSLKMRFAFVEAFFVNAYLPYTTMEKILTNQTYSSSLKKTLMLNNLFLRHFLWRMRSLSQEKEKKLGIDSKDFVKFAKKPTKIISITSIQRHTK